MGERRHKIAPLMLALLSAFVGIITLLEGRADMYWGLVKITGGQATAFGIVWIALSVSILFWYFWPGKPN